MSLVFYLSFVAGAIVLAGGLGAWAVVAIFALGGVLGIALTLGLAGQLPGIARRMRTGCLEGLAAAHTAFRRLRSEPS